MKKWLQKILLITSVIIVVGHSTLPHHHHEEIQKFIQHHHDEEQEEPQHHHDHDDNKDNEHDVFSFAQLDEKFVPAKWQHVTIKLPILYLVTPVVTYQYNLIRERSKTHFGYYKEFPPPGDFLSNLFSDHPQPANPCNKPLV